MIEYRGDSWQVAWSIEPGPVVKVGPWPAAPEREWSREYQCVAGCGNESYLAMTLAERREAVRNLALDLVLQGVPAAEVEREFAKIDVWHGPIRLPWGVVQQATDDGRWNPHNPA